MILYILSAMGGACAGVLIMCMFRLGIVEAMTQQHEAECRNCRDKLKQFNDKFEEYSEKFDRCYGN